MAGPIILIIFIIIIAGLCVWFYLKNKEPKPEPKPEPDEPIDPEPDEPDVPVTPDEPDQPDTPDIPDVPDTPDESDVEPDVPVEPTDSVTEDMLDDFLDNFKSVVTVQKDSKTYAYLFELLKEAYSQFYDFTSRNGIPVLYKKENFPVLNEYYGTEENRELAFNGMVGWMFAILLTETRPQDRNALFKIGYNIGADKNTYIYRYEFFSDQNISRMIGSAIVSAMRGLLKPDMDALRAEMNGQKLSYSLKDIDDDSFKNKRNVFFINYEEFMPTAPGPYLSTYTDRSKIGGEPYPDSDKTSEKNLKEDQKIYEIAVSSYNLDQDVHYQDTVQGIADKEGDKKHILGPDKETEHYHFHPVYGEVTVGRRFSRGKDIATVIPWVIGIGSSARHPLMDDAYYGRRRPG